MTELHANVEFDVSSVLPGRSRAVLAASVIVPPRGTTIRRTVVFAVPGGTYTRSYWHHDEAILPGYDCAQFLAQAGFVVIAVDNLGTGDSTRPADVKPSSELLAHALHVAGCEAKTRITRGDLVEGLAPIDDVDFVGFGHSMGGYLTVLQQSKWETYDRIGVFGTTALPAPEREHVPLGEQTFGGTEVSDLRDVSMEQRIEDGIQLMREQSGTGPDAEYALMPRLALRPFFYGPFVDEDVMVADEGLATELPIRAAAPSGTPGCLTAIAPAITVPLFLVFAEIDVSIAPRREPEAYSSCDDITFVFLRGAAHCHNLAPTRADLWQRTVEWLG